MLVLSVFQSCLKNVSRVFHRCFNEVFMELEGCLKFKVCFRAVLRVCHKCFKGFYKKFQMCLKKVGEGVFQGSLECVKWWWWW